MNTPQWVLDEINKATTYTTDYKTYYLVDSGPDTNPNAPAESRIVIRGPLPDYQFYGEIRKNTMICPFEVSGAYNEQYNNDLESAMKEIDLIAKNIDRVKNNYGS